MNDEDNRTFGDNFGHRCGTRLPDIGTDITNYAFTMPRGSAGRHRHEQVRPRAAPAPHRLHAHPQRCFRPGPTCPTQCSAPCPARQVTRLVSISPTAVTTTPVITVNVLITDYQLTRANTAELTWQVPAQWQMVPCPRGTKPGDLPRTRGVTDGLP